MKSKIPYLIQTVLLSLLLAITPLLYNANPAIFHRIKIQTIYLLIISIFLVSVICFKWFKSEYKLSFRIFKTEITLMFASIFLMICSYFQNIQVMKSFVTNGYVKTGVIWGAGPNYLSIFFYILAMILIVSSVVSIRHTYNKYIKVSVILSLIIVGLIIIYQVTINDFIGVGRTYLFGFGNSNYVPDAFAIIGLLLLVPLMFNDKINYLYTLIGIFFFVIVLISNSRAAFMGLFVSLLVTLIILIKSKQIKGLRVTILGVLAVVSVVGMVYVSNKLGTYELLYDFKSLFKLLTGQASAGSLSGLRTDLWVASIEELIKNPLTILFGNGQSVFIWYKGAQTGLVTNVHNQYIDILLSGGIVVFLIFIVLLFKQYIYAVRLVKHDISNITLLAALIFISVKWMFNSLNAIHSPFVLIIFILISYNYIEIKREEIYRGSKTSS